MRVNLCDSWVKALVVHCCPRIGQIRTNEQINRCTEANILLRSQAPVCRSDARIAVDCRAADV